MRWGIISDSHDHLDYLERALEIFKEEGVSLILHAGDFVSPFTARIFKKYPFQLIGVFGNNDGEKNGLRKAYQGIGEIYEDFYIGEIDGYKVFIAHKEELVPYLARGGEFDFLVYGHTHIPRIERVGEGLIINPGECGGWLKGEPTVAILNPGKREAKIIHLK